MFRSIVRPVRVSRFSKTVSLPQNNSSPIPSNRHGCSFDRPPGSRCLLQPPKSTRSKTAPAVISKTEQTQQSPRTGDLIASAQGRANLLLLVSFPLDPGLEAILKQLTPAFQCRRFFQATECGIGHLHYGGRFVLGGKRDV